MKLKKLLLLDIRSDVGYLSHLSARFWICVSNFAISLLAIPSFLYTTFNRRLAAVNPIFKNGGASYHFIYAPLKMVTCPLRWGEDGSLGEFSPLLLWYRQKITARKSCISILIPIQLCFICSYICIIHCRSIIAVVLKIHLFPVWLPQYNCLDYHFSYNKIQL